MRKKITLLLVVLVSVILFPSFLSETQTNTLPPSFPPASSWWWSKFGGLEKVQCPGGGRMVCRVEPALPPCSLAGSSSSGGCCGMGEEHRHSRRYVTRSLSVPPPRAPSFSLPQFPLRDLLEKCIGNASDMLYFAVGIFLPYDPALRLILIPLVASPILAYTC